MRSSGSTRGRVVRTLVGSSYLGDTCDTDGSQAFWTSLREEPVIYVSGRPHVLRLVDRPLENVE
jgi:hypothetical protein